MCVTVKNHRMVSELNNCVKEWQIIFYVHNVDVRRQKTILTSHTKIMDSELTIISLKSAILDYDIHKNVGLVLTVK